MPYLLRLFGICYLLFLLFPSGNAQGASLPESVYIPNRDGSAVFRLDFFGRGLPYAFADDGDGNIVLFVSANDFSPPVREDIVRGAAYWVDILKPRGAPANVAVLRVGVHPETSFNAEAFYFSNPDDSSVGTLLSSISGKGSPLTPSGLPHDPLTGYHSVMYITDYSWDTQANSNLPETPSTLSPTMIHEIGHSLGFAINDTEFKNLLKGEPGDLNFIGATTEQVFGGPVPMAHSSREEDSHFGVRNGLMTHGQITNYSMFMEVEMAALVDIGYAIDLRNFFGTSLYDDTATLKIVNNTRGFFTSMGSDPSGYWLGYAEGTPNNSLFGVGLHVYGSNYTITQSSDLLADGAGGAGIRVDGFGNRVIIPENALVTANGARGTGLLVSFGSEHKIVSRGVVEAAGPLGIGARFDFGAPFIDEALHSYGIYYGNPKAEVIYDPEGKEVGRNSPEPVKTDIGGPLVESFDLSGALLGGPSATDGRYLSGEFVDYGGRPIALYIGPGAHVKSVNIMNGAFIYGDIISRWDPKNFSLPGDPLDYMTDLTFGMLTDSDGTAIASSSDSAFVLRYRGDILSPSSLNVSLAGGILDYAGSMRVRSFSMATGTQMLTEFLGGRPAEIAASEYVDLAPLSEIGFAPSAFSYGRQLAVGGSPVLKFTEFAPVTPSLLQQSSGTFAVGAFDYAWNGLYWDANRNSVMVNTTQASFNHQRGGTDALDAPLAIIMRQPGLNAVSSRMVNRFSDAAAHGPHSSLLGAPFADTKTFWSRWPPSAGSSGHSQVPDCGNARPGLSYARWLSPCDGGLEVASNRNGIWIVPAYGFLKHRGGRDYAIFGAGVTFGLDRYVAENLYLGLALSLDFPRYESSDADIDGWGATGIFYGGLFLPRGLELGFVGTLGGMRFSQTRAVDGDRYHNSYNAKTISVGASLGRRFEILENFMVRPFVDWHYFTLNRDSYSERPDVYALRYDDSRNHISRLQTGMEGVWATERGSIGVKVYWSGFSGDTKKAPVASFALDPETNRFNAPVDGLDENSLGLGLNFGIGLGANTELRLEYSLLRGNSSTAHEGMIGLNFIF
ncbi:MAG: autotransporter outer membrane beta-barrel domain-containing protein [Deltaproteobacteria bacterium]|jgi:hypothetical protein|nr:autotransporter outer membrane beta-barrel domain-containing protein [Deltaproteobacteria bacterium]